jgi:sulfonate transport system substrate-binding protein
MQRSALIAILAAISLAAAAAPFQSAPDLKIAVNVTTIESFPVFAAEGPGIQLVPSPNGRAAMAQLLSGAVDAATGSETQALINSVTDPRVRIVLTLAECRYRIVARRSAGIRRLADLRGKRIAATTNTSSLYFLSRMLAVAQLKESDVQVINLEGPAMPAALQARTVDAMAIWEPHAQNALDVLGDDAVVLENAAAYTEQFNLNTRTDVLNNPAKRMALQRFVQAIAAASERMREQPAEMIAVLAPKVSLPDRTVKAVWPQFQFPATIPASLQAGLEQVEPWVAAMQQRKPRAGGELRALIDESLIRGR